MEFERVLGEFGVYLRKNGELIMDLREIRGKMGLYRKYLEIIVTKVRTCNLSLTHALQLTEESVFFGFLLNIYEIATEILWKKKKEM